MGRVFLLVMLQFLIPIRLLMLQMLQMVHILLVSFRFFADAGGDVNAAALVPARITR